MLVLLTSPAVCQSVGDSAAKDEAADKAATLILDVRKSNYDPVASLSAIPALREAFTTAPDSVTQENIASVLVMLGQKDEVYWSTLSKRGQEIVDSQAPDPLVYDASGKSIRGAISPEFVEWVKTNGLPENETLSNQLGMIPAELSLLAITGDPRGLSILQKGLLSPNYGVRAIAVQGLAVLQDKASIPRIIEAAKKAPAETRPFIAEPLVAFDDPVARAAAEELIPNKEVLEDLKKRVKEKGARALW